MIFLLVLLVIGGIIFYFRYSDQWLQTSKIDLNVNKKQVIFFLEGSDLIKLSLFPDRDVQKIIALIPTQKSVVANISMDKKGDFLVEAAQEPNQDSAIWKLYLSTSTFESLFSRQTHGLENFSAFRSPSISPDNKKIAFLATQNNFDTLFVAALDGSEISNLTGSSVEGTIASFDWSKDSQNLAFVNVVANQYSVKTINLDKQINSVLSLPRPISQLAYLNDRLLYLDGSLNMLVFNHDPVTLFTPQKQEKIDDFSLSPNNRVVLFRSHDSITGKRSLQKMNIDGSLLSAFTQEKEMVDGVFSPDNNYLALLGASGSIYVANISDTRNQKVYTDENKIDKLMSWRKL